tara:strand:+ start:150 stop:680 length:531 start_codon:yes stop_codon:yes gene_type:complete
MDEDRRNYLVEKFVSEDVLKLFSFYSKIIAQRDNYYNEATKEHNTKFEPQVGHCVDIRDHNDPVGQSLLLFYLPKIAEHLKLKLEPVASYYRIYGPNCRLPMHTDRPDYEWSATICMGYDAPDCWPIYIEEDAIHLEPGDALMYQGSKYKHGRPVFKGSWQTQLFLHYKEVKDERT